jgi:hypothetical protein
MQRDELVFPPAEPTRTAARSTVARSTCDQFRITAIRSRSTPMLSKLPRNGSWMTATPSARLRSSPSTRPANLLPRPDNAPVSEIARL